MRTDLTVVYYTANLIDPTFAARVRESIQWASDGCPVVVVSQQPVDWPGADHNVVGDHEACMLNCRRQMLIGVEAARTPWVTFCEDDTLYPPEFFAWLPEADGEVFYRYDHAYMLWARQDYAWRKRHFETVMHIPRNFAHQLLAASIAGFPLWGTRNEHIVPQAFPKKYQRTFVGVWPIVSIKTSTGMHDKTGYSTHQVPATTLPGWGNVRELKTRLGL